MSISSMVRIFIVLVLCAMSYFIGKTIGWIMLVGSPYMEATYETVRCNKYLAAYHDNQLVRENKLKIFVSAECAYDKKACDKSEKLWSEYEKSQTLFHKRFPL